jgi:3-hydroxybutyryl-CoA dehydrogenase
VSSHLDEMHAFLDHQFGPGPVVRGEIETTGDLADLNERAAYILECIAEDMAQKCNLLRRLAVAADRGAVLMTCTSGLSIRRMGTEAGVGRRLVGAHFWNPPHLMPLVEVVASDATDAGLCEQVSELLRTLGKTPVICADVPGFIGNRLLHALFREAVHLVESGICSAEDVDTVARLTFALRMPAVGPCENMDLVGHGLVADIQSYLLQDLSSAVGIMPLIAANIRQGTVGMRSGRGFYDWSQRDAARLLELRDRQIVQQLRFLAAQDAQ